MDNPLYDERGNIQRRDAGKLGLSTVQWNELAEDKPALMEYIEELKKRYTNAEAPDGKLILSEMDRAISLLADLEPEHQYVKVREMHSVGVLLAWDRIRAQKMTHEPRTPWKKQHWAKR